MTKTTGCSF